MIGPGELLFDGPDASAITVVLAHGAGAPMDSPFMERMARGLGDRGLRVARFEFPYMNRRRTVARAGPPDRPDVLLQRWRDVIEHLGNTARLVIGGKSLGGRIASMVADEMKVAGLACLGYPFHPPGKPERLRTAHLVGLRSPALIVQGTRDPFGKREEIEAYGLSSSIRVVYLGDGDHSFKPRVKSGRTLDQNIDEAIDTVAEFAARLA